MEATSYNRTNKNFWSVSRVIIHPSFSLTPTLRHDIAVFKVASNLDYPSICLNKEASNKDDLCYVAGWGSVDNTGRKYNLASLIKVYHTASKSILEKGGRLFIR